MKDKFWWTVCGVAACTLAIGAGWLLLPPAVDYDKAVRASYEHARMMGEQDAMRWQATTDRMLAAEAELKKCQDDVFDLKRRLNKVEQDAVPKRMPPDRLVLPLLPPVPEPERIPPVFPPLPLE